MSEKSDPSPEISEPPEAPATHETPQPGVSEATDAPAKRAFRDRLSGAGARLNGTRGLVAATLAALIVGGLGGAAIHAAVDDDHDHERFLRGNHPGEMGRDFGGWRGEDERPGPPGDFFPEPPGGVPGGPPPTTPPEDEESSPTPSPSDSPSESSSS